jgi:hypothetical protein
MSHFSVLVCVPGDTDLSQLEDVMADILAPYDEGRRVEPYRDYEEGSPEDYWWVSSVRRGAEHHRDGTGLKPHNPNMIGSFSTAETRRTPDEQRAEFAEDARWAERLGMHPDWETVVRLYNEKYHPGNELAAAGDTGDSERLHYEPESGRAYTWSTYNPETYGMVCCPGGEGRKEDQPTWDEVLRVLRGNEASGGVSPGEANPRQAVRVLQDLHAGTQSSTNAGAAQAMAPSTDLRNHARGVRPALVGTGRSVRDLSGGAAGSTVAGTGPGDDSRGGPLSSDGRGEGPVVCPVQQHSWDGQGRHILANCGNPLPHEPHQRASGLLGGSKWDYWRIGGRWGGYFPVKVEGPGLVYGANSWDSPKETPDGPRCDGGPIRLLDFEAMREDAATKAHDRYDRWEKVCADTPPAKSWSHFIGLVEVKEIDINTARRQYHEQPRIVAAKKADLDQWDGCVVDEFLSDRDEYVAAARRAAVPGYALVTLDREWVAPGRMGWFGMSSDEPGERGGYHIAVNTYLDQLDPGTLLVAVDCHI